MAELELMEVLLVACPGDAEPGQFIVVETPLGTEVEVQIPEGVAAGDEFQVEYAAPRTSSMDSAADLDASEEGGPEEGQSDGDPPSPAVQAQIASELADALAEYHRSDLFDGLDGREDEEEAWDASASVERAA